MMIYIFILSSNFMFASDELGILCVNLNKVNLNDANFL